MQTVHVDVVVIGGGMVGASTALGLAQQGKQVALVEENEPVPYTDDQPADLRVSAISEASVDLLTKMGCWSAIKEKRLCPYRRLETWEMDECRVHFDASSIDRPQLGFIVENRVIQLGIWQQFSRYSSLSCYCPDSLQSLEYHDDGVNVVLSSGRQLQAKLVIGADGANSKVRQLAGIGTTAWDYRHRCMLIHVQTDKAQQDITWQRFTPDGPRSFLPLWNNQASLVWYDSPSRIRQLAQMSPVQLGKEIHQHFPAELGTVQVIRAGDFPLARMHAQHYLKNRCLLVGDAAHTINPLAGQGVNLGFKDVKALLKVTDHSQWFDINHLQRYERMRRPDNLLMQFGMDCFYKGFRISGGPFKLVRNLGLKILDNSELVKNTILRYASGL